MFACNTRTVLLLLLAFVALAETVKVSTWVKIIRLDSPTDASKINDACSSQIEKRFIPREFKVKFGECYNVMEHFRFPNGTAEFGAVRITSKKMNGGIYEIQDEVFINQKGTCDGKVKLTGKTTWNLKFSSGVGSCTYSQDKKSALRWSSDAIKATRTPTPTATSRPSRSRQGVSSSSSAADVITFCWSLLMVAFAMVV
eukprot:TRINITY_DN4400_c0_g1_i1.p1 TRINITY_DN4400_c0_g1~~TRINITY_DN4400_c0_g1_i1.p1  ORF type:complete len:199 (-),score=45.46 TRINITY_DN4400_c0_g1_i1:64-660(-)